MRGPLLGLVCAGLYVAGAAAQQPPVTFKAEVDYVSVDTVVTDAQGAFIAGLTADDFQIFEDGKPQTIASFAFIDLPFQRPERIEISGRLIAADVKSNQHASAGRLYVMVLDDLGTSLFRSSTVRRAARQFIERHFAAGDAAAVLYTSGRTDASQEFTGDSALLLAAVDKFVGRKLRSAMLDKIDTFYRQQEIAALVARSRDPNSAPAPGNSGSASSGSLTDPMVNPYTRGDGYPDRTFDDEDLERGHRALRVLEELKKLSEFLANIQGRRKAVLMFSEGIDYPIHDIFGAQEATNVVRATRDAVTAAARGNVSIFAVDPRGLVGMSADAVALDSPGPVSDSGTAATAANLAGFTADIRQSQDSLRTLADETGGFAFVSGNDPTSAFERVVRANSRYYVLGYYPPTHARDGRFHRIEVRVRRPGARVLTRHGYAAPRSQTAEERTREERNRLARAARIGGADTTSAELRAVLNSPMQQQGGVPMLVHAAPFRGRLKDATVALAIELDTTRFKFAPRNNGAAYANTIELSYFSLNEQGRPLRGERREIELALRPDTYERARQAGLRVNERIALAPGRYQLRIGVRESGTGAVGTVFYDVQVPDFNAYPLALSGLLLTAASSTVVPTLVEDKMVDTGLLSGPATSRRTFASGDDLQLYAEVYDNVRDAHTVSIATRLIRDDGQQVFGSSENARGAVSPLSKRIPLASVQPGRYLVQVEARIEGLKETRSVSRETMITIVAGR